MAKVPRGSGSLFVAADRNNRGLVLPFLTVVCTTCLAHYMPPPMGVTSPKGEHTNGARETIWPEGTPWGVSFIRGCVCASSRGGLRTQVCKCVRESVRHKRLFVRMLARTRVGLFAFAFLPPLYHLPFRPELRIRTGEARIPKVHAPTKKNSLPFTRVVGTDE